MTSRSRLSAKDITVKYGTRMALADFCLDTAPGEVHVFIGPNGSGKSSALRALAGLVSPETGRVELDGRPLRAWRRPAVAKRMAFLPQAPVAPEDLTVRQLAGYGRFAHVGLFGKFGEEDREAVDWALDKTGLGVLAERPLDALSGGERQRAWIASALAQRANILLLDEPTTFLDIGHQVEVLELVHGLCRELGTTVVLVIHDINHALAIADRIHLFREGRVIFSATPPAFAENGLIQSVFNVRGEFLSKHSEPHPRFLENLHLHR